MEIEPLELLAFLPFREQPLSASATGACSGRARGIPYIVVNGVLVLDDGRHTGELPGTVIRGPGYKAAGLSQEAGWPGMGVAGQGAEKGAAQSINDAID